MSCEKHPLLYDNKNPNEFANEFKTWSVNKKHYFFKELNKEYKRESEEDKKGNKPQLSANLEQLATTTYLTSKFLQKETDANLNIKQIESEAKKFVHTNYFYQQECFKQIKKELPTIFETTIKAMNGVCNKCKKHMHNPYK